MSSGVCGHSSLWPFQLEDLEPLTPSHSPHPQAIICLFPSSSFSYCSPEPHSHTDSSPSVTFKSQFHRATPHLTLWGPRAPQVHTFIKALLSSYVPAAWVAVADVTCSPGLPFHLQAHRHSIRVFRYLGQLPPQVVQVLRFVFLSNTFIL